MKSILLNVLYPFDPVAMLPLLASSFDISMLTARRIFLTACQQALPPQPHMHAAFSSSSSLCCSDSSTKAYVMYLRVFHLPVFYRNIFMLTNLFNILSVFPCSLRVSARCTRFYMLIVPPSAVPLPARESTTNIYNLISLTTDLEQPSFTR